MKEVLSIEKAIEILELSPEEEKQLRAALKDMPQNGKHD
jgi:hypothetical protein